MDHNFLRSALLGVCLSLIMAVTAGAAYEGVGTVTGDTLNLRAEPNTTSTVLTQAAKNDVVLVVEQVSEGWYKVDYGTTQGYMSAQWLNVSDSFDGPLGQGRVETEGSSLNLRSAPSTDADKLASLPHGTVVKLTGMKDGWFKAEYDGQEGYLSAAYILAVSEQSAQTSAAASDLAGQLITYAKAYLGTPYVYGSSGPKSFDCSGFTKYVFGHFGYSLNRSAADQLSNGTAVSLDNIQVGDLICWKKYGSSKAATHVGIYIGNDQYIHASTSGSVCINDMSYGSNVRGIVGVRRVL